MEQPIPSQPTHKALVAQHTSHYWRIGDNSYHLRGYEHMAKAATPEGNPLQVWARRDLTSQSLQDTHLNGPPQRCIQHRRVLLYPSGQTIWDAPYDASERHSFPSRTDMVTELWYQADPPQQQQHSTSLVNTPEGIQLKEPCSDGSDEIRMPFACHQALKAYRKTDDYCGDGESSDSDISCDDMTLGGQGVKTPLTKSSGGMLEKARTRQEQKALDKDLDKEIPWQSIMALPPEDLAKYVESARAEETSWQQFSSVVPLTQKEADEVHHDPVLKRRILKARAAYRDKAKGVGPLRAKTRVVALGHNDPDLHHIDRESATPTRQSEYLLYAMFIAGYNRMLVNNDRWCLWDGDVKTAFLQGRPDERHLPLFLSPPTDGVTKLAGTFKSPLYRIEGNV